MILYVYIAPEQGLTTPWGRNFDVNRNILSFRSFIASLKHISLKSDFIQFFHDFIHVYSHRAWADRQPTGDKVFTSTEMSCHFIHLLQVLKKKMSLKSDFIQLFFFFFFFFFFFII